MSFLINPFAYGGVGSVVSIVRDLSGADPSLYTLSTSNGASWNLTATNLLSQPDDLSINEYGYAINGSQYLFASSAEGVRTTFDFSSFSTTSTSISIFDIVYNPTAGVYLARDNTAEVVTYKTSTDLVTWTSRTLTGSLTAIRDFQLCGTYFGLLVINNQSGNNDPYYYRYSSDGVTFTNTSVASGYNAGSNSISGQIYYCAENGKNYINGYTHTTQYPSILRCATTTSAMVGSTIRSDLGLHNYMYFAHNSDKVIAVYNYANGNCYVAYETISSGAITSVSGAIATDITLIYGATYYNGNFIVLCKDSSSNLQSLVSSDGISWTKYAVGQSVVSRDVQYLIARS
jgi:hypothetical protein